MTYRRVLVPLDGSELAERAIPYAKNLVKARDNEVTLFTVSIASVEQLDRPMKAYLELNAKELQSQGIKASTAIAYGNAADEIIKFADKNKIDLIILSTHGHSGIKRWALGSVALKVLHGTCIPVLLIKSRTHKTAKVEFKKILLPLDGSSFSEASIPYVKELAKGTGGEIVILRVSEPPVLPADRSPAIKPSWEEYRDMLMAEIQRQAEKYLEGIRANLGKSGIKARSQATVGKAAENILQVAQKEDINLITMTTHGRTGVSRWVYGSVASRITEESLQPVLLIRPSVPK
jgi:nucleotide-binding universal stress UspA family protein